MPKSSSVVMFVLHLVLAIDAYAQSASPVADMLQRQTQELFDAIASGSTAVWERYLDDDVRFVDESGRQVEELRAEAPDVLFVPGRPRYRYVFQRGAGGKITGLAQRREAWDLVWKRSD
jgi:hypothetical protein